MRLSALRVLAVAFACAAAVGQGCRGQTPPTPPETSILRLFYQPEELVTTPSRIAEDARTAPATAEVYSAEELTNMGARTLSDLLRTLESVYVSVQTNSRESVWIRGIPNRYNDKVLLLVDGIPRRDLVYEHAAIDEYLPLANVERVEIIRGPGSALYGSNAFAGVINIITRKAPSSPGGEVIFGGGNYGTWEGKARGGFHIGETGVFAYAQGLETDGDGLDFERHQWAQTLRQNPKELLSGGVTLTRGGFAFRLEQIHYQHTYYTDLDVPAWRWKDEGYFYNDTFASAQYEKKFKPGVALKATAYYQDYDLRNFWREFIWGRQTHASTPADVDSEIGVAKKGHREGGEVQAAFSAGGSNEIVAGLSLERESLTQVDDRWRDLQTGGVTRPFYIDPVTISTWALYIQDTWKPTSWMTATFGMRADHHSLFGWKTTPRLGVTFHPGRKLVVKLLYGQAFRAPSAREFYTVDETGDFPAGNPRLKPESIETFESALSYTFSSYAEAHLVLYRERTDDAIFSEENLPYVNHEGNTVDGAEAGVRLAWPNRVTAYANASYTKTSSYNVPKFLAHAGVNIPQGDRLNWNVNAIYVSSRPRDPNDRYSYDNAATPYRRRDVPGYLLLNATVRVLKVWRGLELNASVYNILDKDYWDPTFEPTKYYDLKGPNRTYLLRASYRF